MTEHFTRKEAVAWQTIHADGFACSPVSSLNAAKKTLLRGSTIRELFTHALPAQPAEPVNAGNVFVRNRGDLFAAYRAMLAASPKIGGV